MTPVNTSRSDCLKLVDRSPVAVAQHDKVAWLDIFSANAVVEDPVGSTPHVRGRGESGQQQAGSDPLDKFYETFIAANDIRFLVDRDIVCGLHVVRDLTMEITMSREVVVRVPMHLLYELTLEGEYLKIGRLAAHWELRPMLQQQMALDAAHLKVGGSAGWRMLRHQGVAGVVGFMRALSGCGVQGKRQVALFAEYFNSGQESQLDKCGVRDGIVIDSPCGEQRLSVAEFARQGGRLQFGKMLAAGSIVSVSVRYEVEAVRRDGVAFFELDKAGLTIAALRFYWAVEHGS